MALDTTIGPGWLLASKTPSDQGPPVVLLDSSPISHYCDKVPAGIRARLQHGDNNTEPAC
ncbi:hypothetical protein EYF80_039182 [Liparis tanakae]|uniref:Uncharacterized protein n=1 Tax=Liparis tanakae TaxID=230148 RepID=A0A4Z2GAP3_9TELE|nr:hypothetical protein EYF80_039182 [Liparis tanakae]